MHWSVRDFKGLAEASINIRKGRTTVLTGVNSSGKSSIAQSILLATQSLHSDGNLILNGPLVRLGDAQDLVRDNADRKRIEFRIAVDREDGGRLGADGLSIKYDLTPSEDKSALLINHLELSSESSDSPLIAGKENARRSDVEEIRHASSRLGNVDPLHVKGLLGSADRILRTYILMRGLRPIGIIQLMRARQVEAKYRRALEIRLKERKALESPASRERPLSPPLIREFSNLVENAASNNSELQGLPLRRLISNKSGNPYVFDDFWDEISPRVQAELIKAAAGERSEKPYVLIPIHQRAWSRHMQAGLLEAELLTGAEPTVDALRDLGDHFTNLAEQVQYLGPLRDEPRVVWNHWNELARGLPVGTRGEYSAAVLSRSSSRQIICRLPNDSKESAPFGNIITLGEAVDSWLAYLNIGDNVKSKSYGKLGVGLDLTVNGSKRDLTTVGVGVSQALPLIVGLLACPQGSIFMVEQPELHLHPAVQARLADFLTMARADVSVLIETHSDAFITRIRRRIAERAIDPESVDIIFIEPGAQGSTARKLGLDSLGDLSEWPDDFISSTEEDVRAIIQANIANISGVPND